MTRFRMALLGALTGVLLIGGANSASAATSVYHPTDDSRTFENSGWRMDRLVAVHEWPVRSGRDVPGSGKLLCPI